MVVVVNDGDPEPPWDVLDDLSDPRLVRFDLPDNRGRYFADQVVLDATRSHYFLVQDADDWSEPRRIEILLDRLRSEHAVGVVSATYRHDGVSQPRVTHQRGLTISLDRRMRHLANHFGLFRTDALRDIGGFFADFRIGYDTLLVNWLAMTGRLAAVKEPLYHRRQRSGSLTSAVDTGIGSPGRAAVKRELDRMYAKGFDAYLQLMDGQLTPPQLAARVRAISAARVGPKARAAVGHESARLREVLDRREARAAAGARTARVPGLREDVRSAASRPQRAPERLDGQPSTRRRTGPPP